MYIFGKIQTSLVSKSLTCLINGITHSYLGGYDNNASACNDLWEFSLENFTWTKVDIASERPPSRFSHVAVLLGMVSSYDVTVIDESSLVIHGGLGDKGEARDDLWAFKFGEEMLFLFADSFKPQKLGNKLKSKAANQLLDMGMHATH